MITKKQQLYKNERAIELFNNALSELQAQFATFKTHNLRHCDAKVYETDNYFILRSFNTLVAAIDKASFKCADVLRFVYGYTNCSARQISYFFTDFTPYPHNTEWFVWRKIEK